MDKNIVTRSYPDNAQVNRIWRFFSDANQQWRWERLAFDRSVLEHSARGFPEYDSCVANACENGYVFSPSPSSTKPQSKTTRTKRSYMQLPARTPKPVASVAAEEPPDEDLPPEIKSAALETP